MSPTVPRTTKCGCGPMEGKMPSLKLIHPQPDPLIDDEYGFREHFRNASVATLVSAYNRGIGCRAWVSARGYYLVALRQALLATGFDCTSFIDHDGMAMDAPVKLRGREIVRVDN
jgi:hypothetical protein